ncbi:hypothetical protein FZC79_01410 [Rossellomorea vietnamensis]|uniref:Uncharacterized protein n=1 Tax=Rossellomorea vietnamensis TaxID=218284 RepID=A0A5D4KKT7_9BACI|nr:hypothetical protein [Rossellomorea vietnamensis]TYR77500.1 hypothetical protein FZC79_01410 [Rossellomorea vietnamensis]
MQTFLILISFILNIAALLAIVLLYTRQNRLLEVEKRQEKTVKEMEDVISSYLLEMKEDNDRFIQQFQEVNEGQPDLSKAKVEKIKKAAESAFQNESESPSNELDNKKFNSQSYKRQSAARAYKQDFKPEPQPLQGMGGSPQEAENSSTEDPFYLRIKRLQEKEYTLEEIARELGKGVTEIELALKFRQKLE